MEPNGTVYIQRYFRLLNVYVVGHGGDSSLFTPLNTQSFYCFHSGKLQS